MLDVVIGPSNLLARFWPTVEKKVFAVLAISYSLVTVPLSVKSNLLNFVIEPCLMNHKKQQIIKASGGYTL